MPDVYNDALETAPEEIVAEAGTEGAAEEAAAKASAEEAAWAAEAKARAEAKVQAAAQAEAVAKAEAKAAAHAAKVALSKAEAEAAAAARLTAEQTVVKAKIASAAAKAEVAVAATASSALAAETAPLAVAGADLEAGDNGDGEKFVTVVSETAADASGRLSQLSVDDARAGLWLLSHRYVESGKSKLVAFKGHTVELAQTACAPAPEGGSVTGALWKDVQWRQMAQLPLGALYGLIALFFIAMFAVVHYPAKYVPLGVAYTKRKLVEHGVVEKVGGAALALKTHAKTALKAAADTDMGKKGLDLKLKMGGMASQLAASKAVSGSVAMADSIRLKVGDKMRQQNGQPPTEASVVPGSPPVGEEKV